MNVSARALLVNTKVRGWSGEKRDCAISREISADLRGLAAPRTHAMSACGSSIFAIVNGRPTPLGARRSLAIRSRFVTLERINLRVRPIGGSASTIQTVGARPEIHSDLGRAVLAFPKPANNAGPL